jgi:ferrochelatase
MAGLSAAGRLAIVLFNLGGPDRPEAVEPFLRNLFDDPAIIGAPGPIRHLLARWIAKRRAPVAQAIYAEIGGRSPILPETEAQAEALAMMLGGGEEIGVFVAMRYWHPLIAETAARLRDFGPDRIVLLPLYPQFSTTTTASAVAAWHQAARAVGLDRPTHILCCYPSQPDFVAAHAGLIAAALDELPADLPRRLLFSAHGLPERVIGKGDPYQWQVERSARAVVDHLSRASVNRSSLDWRICYQSRVGPLAWIGPATEEEIRRAGGEGCAVVLTPIAFVSEHSETLVELDRDYARLASASGVPVYRRVPALGTREAFLRCLAELVGRALERPGWCSEAGGRLCPDRFARCPHGGAVAG